MSLQKTQMHIAFGGLNEKASEHIGESSPGLSACENVEFLQDHSPTIRSGYRQITNYAGTDYIYRCGLIHGTTRCVTDRDFRRITLNEDAQTVIGGTDVSGGLIAASPELMLNIPIGPHLTMGSGGTRFSPTLYGHGSAADSYLYSDASNTESGLMVVVTYPTVSVYSTVTQIPVGYLNLIDVASGTVLDTAELPGYIATAGAHSSIKLVGHRSNVVAVCAANYESGGIVYGNNVVTYAFSIDAQSGIGAISTVAFGSNMTNASGKRGLLTVAYDKTHAAVTGTDYRVYVAYHDTAAGVAGNGVVIYRINPTTGSPITSRSIGNGAADPGAGYVDSFGMVYDSVNDHLVFAICSYISSITSFFALDGLALTTDANRTTPAIATANMVPTANCILYMTFVSGDTDKDGVVVSGLTSRTMVVSTTEWGGAWAASSPWPNTYFTWMSLGTDVSAAIATTGYRNTYQCMALVSEPFASNSESSDIKTLLATMSQWNSQAGYTLEKSACIFAIQAVDLSGDTLTYQYPPYAPCGQVVAGLATSTMAESRDITGIYSASQRLPSTAMSTTGNFAYVLVPTSNSASQRQSLSSIMFDSAQSWTVYAVDLTFSKKSSAMTQAGSIHACGYPMRSIVGSAAEAAFPYRPRITSVGTNGAGAVITGTNYYTVMYEVESSDGDVMLSAFSDPVTVSAGAGVSSVDIGILVPRFSSVRPGPATIKCLIFRQKDGPYYYVGAVNFLKSTQFSDSGTSQPVFRDQVESANLALGTTTYYDPANVGGGSSLPRQSPGSLRYLKSHKDRLFGVSEDGYIKFTGPYIPGEFPWFSDIFKLSVPEGGFPTGLSSVDGRLLVFKRSSIYAIDGDGPPENGGNGSEFSAPNRVSSNIGCIDGRSIVETPYGTFFRSARGFEMINGGGKVTFVGEPCQITARRYGTTVAAGFDQQSDCVKFLVSSEEEPVNGFTAGTPGGAIICFYVKSNAWSVHRISVTTGSEGDLGGSNFSDMSIIPYKNGNLTLLSSADGRVFIEDRGGFKNSDGDPDGDQYLDPSGNAVAIRLASNNIRLGNSSNSRMRLYGGEVALLNGTLYNAKLRLYYDYSEVGDRESEWDSADLTSRVQYLQIAPDREQMHSVKIEFIAEYDPDGDVDHLDVAPPVPLQMALNVGIQDGFPRIATIHK